MTSFENARWFESDNCSTVHPKIIEALLQANKGHASGYGYDLYTKEADEIFCKVFDRKVFPFYVFNGTGSNSAALAHVLMPYQSVIAADCSHINAAETGAVERIANTKIVGLPTADGKITSAQLEEHLGAWQSEHTSLPRVLHLTQATDNGAVYRAEEVKSLCEIAHKHGLLVHMDGARLANAVAANQDNLSGVTCDAGVDILSFGGTKNGLMFGEAIVFFEEGISKNFKYTRKSCGQLPSKMRYIAAQFSAALKDGLWLEMAHHANNMAMYLYEKMKTSPCFEGAKAPDANELFVFVQKDICMELSAEIPFLHFGPEPGMSRFVTSFDTEKAEIDACIARAEELAEEKRTAKTE